VLKKVAIVLDTEFKQTSFKTQEELVGFRDDLVNRLVAAGLAVTLFYSLQEDEVYIKIGADDRRLLEAADEFDHSLALDEHALRIVAGSNADAASGRGPIRLEAPFDHRHRFETSVNILGLPTVHIPGFENHPWHKLDDAYLTSFVKSMTTLSPFEQLHAPYNDDWERHHKEKNKVQIYQMYGGSILRTADRLKLVQLIIEGSRIPNPITGTRGAGINLSEIVVKKKAMASFPLQTAAAAAHSAELSIDELAAKWGKVLKVPWHQPYDDIRDYFGEKIALYFAFLGHYTMWLFAASVVGTPMFLHQMAIIDINDPSGSLFAPSTFDNTTNTVVVWTDVPEIGFFAIFISLWGSFMIEFWKRKQARLALRWGTSSFEENEVVRPEFAPTHFVPDPVTGRSMPYYSPRKFFIKVLTSLCVVFACLLVVIGYIASIYSLKTYVTLPSTNLGFPEEDATILALILNAILIQILGTAYKTIAKLLNDWCVCFYYGSCTCLTFFSLRVRVETQQRQ